MTPRYSCVAPLWGNVYVVGDVSKIVHTQNVLWESVVSNDRFCFQNGTDAVRTLNKFIFYG